MVYRLLLGTLLLFLLASCTPQQTANTNAPPAAPAPAAATTPAASASPAATPCDFTKADRGNCAWQLFIQANSPTNATVPKYWETNYRSSETVYLPTGCPPSPFASPSPTPPASVQQQAQQLPGYVPGSVIHDLGGVNKFQVDGLVLKDIWGGNVLYQILMDQDAFNYIVQQNLYNVEGQAQRTSPANFPTTSFELKTSWIWLGADAGRYNELKGTYYIVPAYYDNVVNGKSTGYVVGNAALAGMHIINKQQPDWIWITFENVNNPKWTKAKLELPIPDYALQANKTYQQQLQSQGSVFANYQLDGVQLAFEDPKLLANSTIESAFQTQSSCMTCHALASIKPNTGGYFNIVNNQGGNVSYYTGNPPDLTGWTSLDFVWSLKRASRRNNNPCTPTQ